MGTMEQKSCEILHLNTERFNTYAATKNAQKFYLQLQNTDLEKDRASDL